MTEEEYNQEKLNRFLVIIRNVYSKFHNVKPIETNVQDTETILYKKFEQDYIKDFNHIIIKYLNEVGNYLVDISEDTHIKENSTMFKNKLAESIEILVINGFKN